MAGAGAEDLDVVVVAPNDDMVVRPRLHEDDPQAMRVSLDRVCGTIGVRRLPATAVDAHTVTAMYRQGREVSLGYDRLVVASIPGEKDELGRLAVDEHLKVIGLDDVYATGDSASAHADADHLTMQACQHAVPLGKHAGHNVGADLYVTCLDLGPGRAVHTEGWDREVKKTGSEAKELKAQINTDWIHPPVDDRAAILDLADPARTWPID